MLVRKKPDLATVKDTLRFLSLVFLRTSFCKQEDMAEWENPKKYSPSNKVRWAID